jgi:hypothetical protein
MPFDSLPNFPEGGVGRSSDGTGGIPPDSIRQALQGTGQDLITGTIRPEDTPAVQAVIGSEVDTILRSQGQLAPPSQPGQAPSQQDTARLHQVPGFPDTTTSPAVPSGDLEDRIRKVMQKYNQNPEEIAKALVYSNKARTETSQDLSGLTRTVSSLASEVQNLRSSFANPPQQGYRQSTGYDQPSEPVTTTPQVDGDTFLRDPVGVLSPVIEQITNRVMKENILAYSDAQRQVERQQKFENLRRQNQQEEAILSPIMDQIYQENPGVYARIGSDEAYVMLLSQARDRVRGMKGEAFLQEIQEQFGGNGQPIPGQTGGALPRPGAPTARVAPGTPTSWSETQAFNRLWKSQTPLDEDRALQDILRERQFGDDIKL